MGKRRLVLTHRPRDCNLSHSFRNNASVITCSSIQASSLAGSPARNWHSSRANRSRRAKARNRRAWRAATAGPDRDRRPCRNCRSENGRAWRVRFRPRWKSGTHAGRRRSCAPDRFQPASRARDKASHDRAPIRPRPVRSRGDSRPPALRATPAAHGCAPASRARRNGGFARRLNRHREELATRGETCQRDTLNLTTA